jgi:hypothetical protein
MVEKPDWMKGMQIGFRPEERSDLCALQSRLASMNEKDLISFGKAMKELAFPILVSHDRKPSLWLVQYNEARVEWRRRHPR